MIRHMFDPLLVDVFVDRLGEFVNDWVPPLYLLLIHLDGQHVLEQVEILALAAKHEEAGAMRDHAVVAPGIRKVLASDLDSDPFQIV